MQEKKRIQTTDVCDTLLARDWKDPKCVPIEEDANPIRIGNIYDESYGTGYAGNVWDKDGISPTLQTAQGGNRQPLVLDEIKVVGNYMPSNHDASRVVDVDGIAPTVKENHGTVTAIAEPQIIKVDIPQIVKIRIYEVDTDKLSTTLKEHKKAVGLTNKDIANQLNKPLTLVEHWFRTDECFSIPDPEIWMSLKALLKIDTDEFDKSIMTFEEKPGVFEKSNRCYHQDGISPTITCVEGEKVIVNNEPFIVASRGRNPENPSDRTTGIKTEQRFEPNKEGICNCLTSVQKDSYVVEPIVCEERKDEGLRFFKDDCVGTLRTIDACGDKRVLEPEINPKLVGGVGEKNFGKQYRQGNRVYDSDEIAMALNSQPVGNAGGYSYLYAVEEEQPKIRWRIRKLIPLECWRLMNFTDQDCNCASKYVSASALYKQAGNSIVVACLIAIFCSLFLEDGYKAEV